MLPCHNKTERKSYVDSLDSFCFPLAFAHWHFVFVSEGFLPLFFRDSSFLPKCPKTLPGAECALWGPGTLINFVCMFDVRG